MNTTVETPADVKPAAETKLTRLVRVLREITDLAERYGVAEHCDGNIIEARDLIAEWTKTPMLPEPEIVAYLAQVARESGIDKLALSITSDQDKGYGCVGKSQDGGIVFADTIDELLAILRLRIKTPQQRAEEKRMQAKKLIAEAEALDPATPAQKGAA